jgi:hypothetical protein
MCGIELQNEHSIIGVHEKKSHLKSQTTAIVNHEDPYLQIS